MKSQLLSIQEAADVLGLRSKASLYRKIKSGQLKTFVGSNGKPRIAREGLEDLWASITRTRIDSPRPRRASSEPPVPLRPLDERLRQAVVIDQAPDSVRSSGEVVPDYNESRAKSEYEKSLLLELERKQKEGLLVPRKDVETTWAQVITTAKTKILGVPSRVRQRIPHLSLEEVDIISGIIREALEEIAVQAEDIDD